MNVKKPINDVRPKLTNDQLVLGLIDGFLSFYYKALQEKREIVEELKSAPQNEITLQNVQIMESIINKIDFLTEQRNRFVKRAEGKLV